VAVCINECPFLKLRTRQKLYLCLRDERVRKIILPEAAFGSGRGEAAPDGLLRAVDEGSSCYRPS
jgi:hypothetical protein